MEEETSREKPEPEEVPTIVRREVCQDCERPKRVCVCAFLPSQPIELRTRMVILQHPDEKKRAIRTGKLLQLSLSAQSCQVFEGKKFPGRHDDLRPILEDPGTVLLYPGKNSRELREDFAPDPEISNIILLDGTWDQAKKMFLRNPALQKLKQIMLRVSGVSVYSVRTQPTDGCLSTLESAVHSAAIIEGRKEIMEPLLRPLLALCDIQHEHGALKHDSHQHKCNKCSVKD